MKKPSLSVRHVQTELLLLLNALLWSLGNQLARQQKLVYSLLWLFFLLFDNSCEQNLWSVDWVKVVHCRWWLSGEQGGRCFSFVWCHGFGIASDAELAGLFGSDVIGLQVKVWEVNYMPWFSLHTGFSRCRCLAFCGLLDDDLVVQIEHVSTQFTSVDWRSACIVMVEQRCCWVHV